MRFQKLRERENCQISHSFGKRDTKTIVREKYTSGGSYVWGSPVIVWSGAVERLALPVDSSLNRERGRNTDFVDSRCFWGWVVLCNILSLALFRLRAVTVGQIQPSGQGWWSPICVVDKGAGCQDQGVGQLLLHLHSQAEVGEEDHGACGQDAEHSHQLHVSFHSRLTGSLGARLAPFGHLGSLWHIISLFSSMFCQEKKPGDLPGNPDATNWRTWRRCATARWGIIAHTLCFRQPPLSPLQDSWN